MALRDMFIKVAFDGDINPIEAMDKATDKLKKTAMGASDKFKDMGKSMQGTGKKLMAGVTLPIVGVGAAAIKTVATFDDSMSRVGAISGATGDEFNDLRNLAKKLGSETAHSASDAAAGMEMLAASGKTTNEILDMTPQMLTLMSAGAVDATTAAKTLTGTMAQFGLKASDSERIIDVFAKGAMSANTNVGELQEAFKMAGGEMANMNMDIEQSTAMIDILADANIVGGQAGTTIAAMSREIKANSKNFKKLGIDVYDSSGKMKDMGTIMTEVEGKTGKMTDAQRNQALATVFSGESMKGVNAFIGQGSEKYNELTESLYGAKGAAIEMAEASEDNIGGAMRSMKSAIEGFAIEIGDVIKGPVKAMADFIGETARKFGELDEPTRNAIVKFALVAAAIGPVLLVGGKMLSFIGGIPAKVAMAKSAFTLLQGAMNPTTLIIAAVVAAGILLYKNWDTVKAFGIKLASGVSGAFNSMKNKTIAAWNGIKTGIDNAIGGIKEGIQGLKDFVKNPIKGTVSIVRNIKDKITGKADGSHYSGLARVPKNNYIANLHKNEEVLKANDPRNQNNNAKVVSRNNSSVISYNPNVTIEIKGSADNKTVDSLESTIKRILERERKSFFDNLSLQQA